MEDISIRVTRSIFPLSKIYFSLNGKNFTIKSGEKITIPLKKNAKYEFDISLLWIKKKFNLDLDNNSIIKIKHVIPDIFYILSSSLLIILAILSFLSLINILIFSISLLIYVSPLVYFALFDKKNYFKIDVKK
jgi:hypothetical protein